MSRIQILLALHNGVAYLNEQLDSIAAQTDTDWALLVSDDGSTDAGPEQVRQFAATRSPDQVHMIDGPCQGAAANFMHLLRRSDASADYLAFSDQDDVWMPEKLARARAALAVLPATEPAFYCSRTLICDANLHVRYPSRIPARAMRFENALVQNVAAGNTIVMNRAAADLVRSALAHVRDVVIHDWWIYQIISGAGGRIIHDDDPSLYYRQHGGNEIGSAMGLRAFGLRGREVLRGRYRRWNDSNISALGACAAHLTPVNRTRLAHFAAARRGPLPSRLANLWRTGAYRQGRIGNVALWLSAMLGRM